MKKGTETRQNLKNARQSAGMTQQQVADYLNRLGIEWKIIQDGRLIACNDGNIYRKYKDGWRLFESHAKGPYIHIGLSVNGTAKYLSVHRLIAETFIPNPYRYEQVNHIDGNGHNNNVSNLEWCDAGYNVRDSKKRHSPRYLTNLRAMRVEYGFTIGSMSHKLGILQGVYCDIENAVMKPIPFIAKKLEDMFGDSIDHLLAPAEED